MREQVLTWLRCPHCRSDGALALHVTRRDGREVRDGTLACTRCGATYEIVDGIIDLLVDPPDFVRREIAGLERFAEMMRNEGWDADRIRALPDEADGYWSSQKGAIHGLLERIAFAPGQRLVDVGANTCWASNIFARRGLEVLALDVSAVDLQGLRAAEHFLDRDEVYFERVLSTMFDPALANESADYAFCCLVMHHNRPRELRRTFAEMYRILRPGGVLMAVNEPLRFPLRPKRDHGAEVAEFEGNENVYYLHEYCRAARRAGFRVHVTAFESVSASLHATEAEVPADARLAGPRRAFRRRRAGRLVLFAYRLARFAWRYVLRGDANITLVCTKPARPSRG